MGSRVALGAWLAGIALAIAIIARTDITADISAFLPRTPTPEQQVLVDQLREGVVSRLILIGLEGGDPRLLAQTSKGMAARLREDARFAAIANGEDTGSQKDRDFVWAHRYRLSPAMTVGHFTPSALRASLEESLQLLGSPAGLLLQRILPADPTGETLRIMETLEGATRPESRDGVWFAPGGERALLVAQTRAPGYDIDAQEDALAAIRAAYVQAPGNPAAVKLLYTGPGVFSVATRERIRGDAVKLSLAASILVGALMLVVYRSVRVFGLGLLPVASGALAGIAAVSLAFGSVHGITLGFGSTLIGEGADYAIYLFTQTRRGAPGTASDRLWPTLRLGVLTSICGFGAMLFSGFTGLAQLGLFSIAGLVTAFLVTRWVLPALMPAGFSVEAASTLAPRTIALVDRLARLRYPAVALVAFAIAFLVLRESPMWSDELASLSPVATADKALDDQLRRDIGAPDVRHLVVVRAAEREAVLALAEDVGTRLAAAQAQGLIDGFDTPTAYLPSAAAQRARMAALPEPAALRRSLDEASHGLPFRAGLFEPFLRDVEAARAGAPVDRGSLEGTSLALKVDSLLVKQASGWAAMLPLRGVRDSAAVGHAVGTREGVVVLDLKAASDALYRGYRHAAVRDAAIGAAAIAALLLVALRSPRRVILVLAPLAAAVIVTTSVILLTGSRLSIFHLVGLLLVVAVGSNYSLFFDRDTVSHLDRGRTLVSLGFANFSTVIGFGVLSLSAVPVLAAIGSTVALGAILSLAFSAALMSERAPRAVESLP